jgi:hypothetical protein
MDFTLSRGAAAEMRLEKQSSNGHAKIIAAPESIAAAAPLRHLAIALATDGSSIMQKLNSNSPLPGASKFYKMRAILQQKREEPWTGNER